MDAENEYLAWTMGGDLRRTQSPGSIWARSPFPPSEKEDVPPEPGSDEWIDRRLQELETLGCSSPSKRGYCDHSTFLFVCKSSTIFCFQCFVFICVARTQMAERQVALAAKAAPASWGPVTGPKSVPILSYG